MRLYHDLRGSAPEHFLHHQRRRDRELGARLYGVRLGDGIPSAVRHQLDQHGLGLFHGRGDHRLEPEHPLQGAPAFRLWRRRVQLLGGDELHYGLWCRHRHPGQPVDRGFREQHDDDLFRYSGYLYEQQR